MSKTAVIVALIIALCLGTAALWLTGGNGKPQATGPILAIDPSTVTEMRLTLPDGSSQSVVRSGPDWRVEIASPGKPMRSWPAAEQQVHAALRIFAALKPDREGSGSMSKVAGTLAITSGASSQTLKVSDQRLAGSVLVESAEGAVWVDANIAEMLIVTGIKAWRDAAALPGVATDAARISISSDTGAALSLARVQGKWFLREPIAEAADPETVSKLVSILASAKVQDFCDGGVPAQAKFAKPIARLVVETDVRDTSGKSSTIKQTITVGPAADVGNRSVFAKLERTGSGPGDYSEVCIIDREQLAAIPTDATLFISRQVVRGDAGEIGQVSIHAAGRECQSQSFRRAFEGWESRCGESDWALVRVDDGKSLQSLLDLFTKTLPEKAMLNKAAPPLEPFATITVASAGGAPIATLVLATDGKKLVIDTEHVRRQYADNVASDLAAWLGRK